METIKALYQITSGSEAEFTAADKKYPLGVPTFITSGANAGRMKIGDAVHHWNERPFFPPLASGAEAGLLKSSQTRLFLKVNPNGSAEINGLEAELSAIADVDAAQNGQIAGIQTQLAGMSGTIIYIGVIDKYTNELTAMDGTDRDALLTARAVELRGQVMDGYTLQDLGAADEPGRFHYWQRQPDGSWFDLGERGEVSKATDAILGLVMGSGVEYEIHIEPDGTMSVNGLSAKLTALDGRDGELEAAIEETAGNLDGFQTAQGQVNTDTAREVGEIKEAAETLSGNFDAFKTAQEQNNAEQQQATDTHKADKTNPHGVTKTQVGLGSVDNTSDADKPVSTAQGTAITNAVGAETTARQNADTALGSRIDRVEGMGGALSAHAFGTLTPTQEQLVEYYCVGIWGNYDYDAGAFTWDGADPAQSTYEIEGVTHYASEIFNNTWFRNTYQNSSHRFVLTNTPDTEPPIFTVTDVGVDTVGEATDTLAGVAKLYNGLGENTDGAPTQAAVKTANDAKVDKSGGTMTGGLNMGNNGIGSVGVLADVSAIVAKDGNLLIKGRIELDADHGSPLYNIKNVKTPVDSTDAANKGYVDTQDEATLTAAKDYADKRSTATKVHTFGGIAPTVAVIDLGPVSFFMRYFRIRFDRITEGKSLVFHGTIYDSDSSLSYFNVDTDYSDDVITTQTPVTLVGGDLDGRVYLHLFFPGGTTTRHYAIEAEQWYTDTGVQPGTVTNEDPGVAFAETAPVLDQSTATVTFDKPTIPVGYSTTETFTGKYWIDGKPVYRRVFTGNVGGVAGKQTVTLLPAGTVDMILAGSGFFGWDNESRILVGHYDPDGPFWSKINEPTGGGLTFTWYIPFQGNNSRWQVWVEYTKL